VWHTSTPNIIMAAIQISALDSTSLPIEHKPLTQPPLKFVAAVLEAGLKENFSEVSVTVEECPDLRESPWCLAERGLGGESRVLDIGGVPYLMPTVQRDKLYNMRDYPSLTGLQEGLVIGAGAAPWPYLGRNAEMMPNLFVKKNGSVIQETHIARTHDEDGSFSTQKLPQEETRNSLLGNLYISEGLPGPVLRIHCRKRTGDKNFVSCIRSILEQAWPHQSLGMGGVFGILQGKARFHVMPDFSPCPLLTDEEVNNWLKFYEMSAPLTVLSVLVSRDPGLDLRVEHSHGWGEAGQGGHYHYDTTPEEVEYLGYFNTAQTIYRVDRPTVTHMVGRD